jgi:hypothetical protein
MSLKSQINALFNSRLNSDTVRQSVLPAGAAITLTANGAGSTYGVWADVALAATITVPTLVVGVFISAPSAPDIFTIDVGSCYVLGTNYANAAAVIAAGAPTVAAAHRQEAVLAYQQVTAVGVGIGVMFVPFYSPVYVPAAVGLIGRCYGITAAAVTVAVRYACVTGF